MANTVRIKRRASGSGGAPSTLENAELAFNEIDNILYYGKGTGGAGGSATTIETIGGKGGFAALTGTQTIAGAKTFSTIISGAVDGNAATATAWATARTLTLGGDLTGSVSIDGSGAIGLTAAVVDDSHNHVAANIDDFDGQVRTNRISQMSVPNTAVDWNDQRLTGLATPTQSDDATTKGYVDSIKEALDLKESVRVATTAAGTLSSSFENGDAIDGVTLATGNRILIKNQSTGSENGIYTVNASGAPTRAADANASADVTAGMYTFVSEGTANADTGFVLTTNDPITLGTTALSFTQFSGAGQITAGTGLTKSANTINAGGTSNRISVSADAIDIHSSYVGQTSVTTLGTIATGTWASTDVGVPYGGTGVSTFTSNGILYGNAAGVLQVTAAGTAGYLLQGNGSGSAPSWTNVIDGGSF